MQGIQVKMITGDHLLIGIETARMLGLGTEMYPSEVSWVHTILAHKTMAPAVEGRSSCSVGDNNLLRADSTATG